MEDITDVDYTYIKRVSKYREKLGAYHDLYAQGDTLLLADVFINFQNMS